MGRSKELVVKCISFTLFGLLGYLTFATLVFFVAFLSFRASQAIELPWVHDVQRYLYTRGWNVWQSQQDCIQFRDGLIYEPRQGACQFSNLEFDTTTSFDEFGRLMPKLANRSNAIALVGDSFAMGWGVEDEQTYAAVLQAKLDRQVYNLSVSSYGTYRELLRLQLSGLHEEVDTVIIQYCDNDLGENSALDDVAERDDQATFSKINDAGKTAVNPASFVLEGLQFALIHPLNAVRKRLFWRDGPKNFDNHYDALIQVLQHFEYLEEKNVVVIYNNSMGQPFRNYPAGQDSSLPNLHLLDIQIPAADHFPLDGHLNVDGHKSMGAALADALAELGY